MRFCPYFGVMVGRVVMRPKAGAKPVQSRCKPGPDRPCTGFGAGLDRLCLGRCANLKPHHGTACSETETGMIKLFTVEVAFSM
jgi:hypothetical protein